MNVDGVSAVVTGGASGLGEATVRRLASAGAKVVILDRDEARGGALAAELGAGAAFAEADVTNAEAVQAAIDRAGAMAPLRVAVNCAGIGTPARVVGRDGSPHTLDAFERVLGVNLVGTFNVLRLAAAAIAKTEPVDGERGVIVNTASVAAFDGQIGQIAYSASKGGVVGMTLPAARDLARHLIRVNTVAPGTFKTPLLGQLSEEAQASLAEAIPHPHRLGDPAEFASLIAHIVENAYINGEVIRIDGSLRMAPR